MTKLGKFFIAFTLIALFSSCGYTPIFSKKTVNFSIENIEFLGKVNRNVKEKIIYALSAYKSDPKKEKKISLIFQSSKNTIIVSKNQKGEPQVYKVNLQIKMKAILAENNYFEKNIEQSATYSAVERKSDEKLIENKVVENLSNQIAQQIILELLEKTK